MSQTLEKMVGDQLLDYCKYSPFLLEVTKECKTMEKVILIFL